MKSIANTSLRRQCEVLAKIGKAASKELVPETVRKISKNTSNCIPDIQRGIIGIQKCFPKLNKYSNVCNYFGVDSAKNIKRSFDNQMALTWLKSKEQNLVNFPPIVLSGEKYIKSIPKAINKLIERGFGRLTVTDKLFGRYIEDGTHTIGIVYHKNKYYVLDSIPETYPEIKDYHERLIKFLRLNPKDIIFSNKPQQSLEEYTCNNWTHANLDAVINYLKGTQDKELTHEVFDKILPRNINKVLYKQFQYIFKELKGRGLVQLIIERYNKKNMNNIT